MKGRVIRAKYVWIDEPETVQVSHFAVNCEQFPEAVDNMIMFYFDSEEDLEDAKTDSFRNDFKITEVV